MICNVVFAGAAGTYCPDYPGTGVLIRARKPLRVSTAGNDEQIRRRNWWRRDRSPVPRSRKDTPLIVVRCRWPVPARDPPGCGGSRIKLNGSQPSIPRRQIIRTNNFRRKRIFEAKCLYCFYYLFDRRKRLSMFFFFCILYFVSFLCGAHTGQYVEFSNVVSSRRNRLSDAWHADEEIVFAIERHC